MDGTDVVGTGTSVTGVVVVATVVVSSAARQATTDTTLTPDGWSGVAAT